MIEGKEPAAITKITLNDATFNGQEVEPTFINFLYGKNGVGKSTFAKVIKYYSDKSKYANLFPEGCHSELETRADTKLDDYSVLVFDQEYIDRSFKEKQEAGSSEPLDVDPIYMSSKKGREADTSEATFVATKENVDIDNAIEEKKAKKAKLQEEGEAARLEIDALSEDRDHYIETTQADVYNSGDIARKKFPESQQGLIRGSGKEQKFFDKLRLVQIPQDEQERAKYTIDAIEELYERVHPKDQSKLPRDYSTLEPPSNLYGYRNLRGKELMEKEIRSTSESPVKQLINDLSNADWVRQGFQHYAFSEKNTECKCPFCQQKLPQDFKKNIEAYFDKTYESDVAGLNEFLRAYTAETSRIYRGLLALMDSSFPGVATSKLGDRLEKLDFCIKSNIQTIEQKIKEPGKSVSLPDLGDVIEDIKDIIKELNDQILESKKLYAHLDTERDRCNNMVWMYLAIANEAKLKSYDEQLVSYKEKIALKQAVTKKAKTDVELIDAEIKKLRQQRIDISEARENINKLLAQSGFQGFHLAEVPKTPKQIHTATVDDYGDEDEAVGSYRVIRENGKPANHLSEGEKNFVAFLYFYYTVIGSINVEGIDKPRIVVIDDPVSSMDSSALFIVSSLVRRLVEMCHNYFTPLDHRVEGDDIGQIFILTHNVYFHKEITMDQDNDDRYNHVAFFLMQKAEKNISTITPCYRDKEAGSAKQNYNPVQSSYSLLWKEYDELTSPMSVMNVIRQILENYFIHLCGYKGSSLHDMILGPEHEDDFCIKNEKGEVIDRTDYYLAESMIRFLSATPAIMDQEYYQEYSDGIRTTYRYKKVFEMIFRTMDQGAHYDMMMLAVRKQRDPYGLEEDDAESTITDGNAS